MTLRNFINKIDKVEIGQPIFVRRTELKLKEIIAVKHLVAIGVLETNFDYCKYQYTDYAKNLINKGEYLAPDVLLYKVANIPNINWNLVIKEYTRGGM